MSYNKSVSNISQRMSLRAPQHHSLDLLAKVADAIPLKKEQDLAAVLTAVQAIAPTLTNFERDFPSLCFALATGVGKTRLMGAFIAYLATEKKLKHFLVISPNRTIYTKLIADFSPNTPKYVFKGLGTLMNHYIVTGDDFESKRGHGDLYGNVELNIFNIAKLTGHSKDSRKVRSLRETLGQSYFEYLQHLPDLVVIMDEAHHHHAPAARAMLTELKPVLGLELTATPFTANGTQRLGNIAYSYMLADALKDGFVKTPTVATRRDFVATQYTDDDIELIKLQDAITVHEDTKVHLAIYSEQLGRPQIKPFILIIAQNIEHATKLKAVIEGSSFFHGRYAGKVIRVDSDTGSGNEKDEVVEQLLSVEDPKNAVEVVIHVNMLKEGWDVTNLFTIVPLRAANARVLIEQSIGRGLRLPFGERTGVEACDRLTIVAHDKFDEIIAEAKREGSILAGATTCIIPERITTAVVSATTVDTKLFGNAAPGAPADALAAVRPEQVEAAKAVQAAIVKVANEPGKVPNSKKLLDNQMQVTLFEVAKAVLPPGSISDDDLKRVTLQVTQAHFAGSIDIPRVVVYPDPGSSAFGYNDFDLDPKGIEPRPVERSIFLKSLHDTSHTASITIDEEAVSEQKPENYLVSALIDFPDVDYRREADLLYKLSGQMVDHLRSYLKKDGEADEDDVLNVLVVHQKMLADFIHQQMEKHSWSHATRFVSQVTSGFRPVKPITYQAPEGTTPRDVCTTLDNKLDVKSLIFTGFKKCLVTLQKFDSDAERRFALICEDDPVVQKWVKPSRDDRDILLADGSPYHVDFVVEAETMKYMVEVKRGDQLTQKDVVEKANAARRWCAVASHHASQVGDKQWKYLLIPDSSIKLNMTLDGLVLAADTAARS